MAASITTFSGRRCTVIPRTQFLTSISTSAATETAGLPDVLSSFTTSTIQDTPGATLTALSAQPTDSNPESSITSLAATAIAASSTITTAATSLFPAITSSSTDPSQTDTPGNDSGDSTGNTSKKNIIAAAIGASLGAVAVVALVILCAYVRRRKRRTSTQFSVREKGPVAPGWFTGAAQPLGRFNVRPVTAFIPAIIDKVRLRLANIQRPQFMARNRNDDPIEQSQSASTTRGFYNGRPTPQEKSMQGANMLGASRKMTESANPFADPSATSTGADRNNTRSENPFADPKNPFTTDSEDERPFSLPLTIRNGVAEDDSVDDNTNRHDAPDTLSGSTFNVSNTRASSPLVHDFFSHWKLPDRKSMRSEDRSSTYSDPFDLERPPTIHSSANPTPLVERQKFQKEGYFPDMNFNFTRQVS